MTTSQFCNFTKAKSPQLVSLLSLPQGTVNEPKTVGWKKSSSRRCEQSDSWWNADRKKNVLPTCSIKIKTVEAACMRAGQASLRVSTNTFLQMFTLHQDIDLRFHSITVALQWKWKTGSLIRKFGNKKKTAGWRWWLFGKCSLNVGK